MFAVPAETAVTVPFETVATDVLLLLHETELSDAFDGATVAVSCSVEPSSIEVLFLLSETPVTCTVSAVYVTSISAPYMYR